MGGTPFASLWRTRGYLQPYLWQLALMLVAALVAVGTEIAIPLLTKSVIDGAIAEGRRDDALALAEEALALAGAAGASTIARHVQEARAQVPAGE